MSPIWVTRVAGTAEPKHALIWAAVIGGTVGVGLEDGVRVAAGVETVTVAPQPDKNRRVSTPIRGIAVSKGPQRFFIW